MKRITPAPGPSLPSNALGYSSMIDRVAAETRDHELVTLHDSGPYRHLRLQGSRTSDYWFEVTTWPDYIAVNGSMGSFIFRMGGNDVFDSSSAGAKREPIVLAALARAVDRNRGLREYDMEAFAQAVLSYVVTQTAALPLGDRQAIVDDVLARVILTEEFATQCEEGAREAIASYDGHLGFQFAPDVEWDFSDYSAALTWSAHALDLVVKTYRDRATTRPSATPAPAADRASIAAPAPRPPAYFERPFTRRDVDHALSVEILLGSVTTESLTQVIYDLSRSMSHARTLTQEAAAELAEAGLNDPRLTRDSLTDIVFAGLSLEASTIPVETRPSQQRNATAA